MSDPAVTWSEKSPHVCLYRTPLALNDSLKGASFFLNMCFRDSGPSGPAGTPVVVLHISPCTSAVKFFGEIWLSRPTFRIFTL